MSPGKPYLAEMPPAKVEPWTLELRACGFGGTASVMLRCWLPPIAGPKPLPDSWCDGLFATAIGKRWATSEDLSQEHLFEPAANV